jgi:hypothetical protein
MLIGVGAINSTSTEGVREPDGVTQATCARSALRNCSSVILGGLVEAGVTDAVVVVAAG